MPSITIVPTNGSADRVDRVRAFSDPAVFPVCIRRLADGAPVERTVLVQSVARGLSTVDDWPEIVRTFVHDARPILPSTGDSG